MPSIVYSLLMTLVAALLPLKLLWRGRRQRDYLHHWGERYGFYTQTVTQPVLWVHCVSVGETRAAQPLIQALLDTYPQHQILITHGTPTGRETSGQLFQSEITHGRVMHAYLPVDLSCAARRFLKHFQPVLGMLMETELWFNLISAASTQGVPMALLSARLSEKSAAGYARLGQLTRQGLQALKLVAAQTAADAARLQSLGAHAPIVCGNLKFDVSPPASSAASGVALRAWLGTARTVCMAASTREGEEALLLDAIQDLDILTLLVPRHPQRFAEVEALLKQRGVRYVLRSTLTQAIAAEVQVVLGDSMGEMYTYYAASDFAVMGGSLQPLGGQNLIEAAAMGIPTILGPSMYNFAQVAQAAADAGAAIQLHDLGALRPSIRQLYQNKAQRQQMAQAAKTFIQTHQGTTGRVMNALNAMITIKQATK